MDSLDKEGHVGSQGTSSGSEKRRPSGFDGGGLTNNRKIYKRVGFVPDLTTI